MNNYYGNVVLVTGASSGIGKEAAEHLMRKGYKVYGTSRKLQTSRQDETSGGSINMMQLDVCSEESIEKAVNCIIEKEGRINILINCAGFGIAGSVEDTSIDEAYKQFDTNFFGVLRMCRSVLPIMRAQKKGLIINVSSIAGLISIPYQSMYSASKFALEAATEALRSEVKLFGINVSLVESGDTKTGFTGKRQFTQASETLVYRERFTKSIDAMAKSEQNGPGPEVVVKSIIRVINSKNPPVRIACGFSYKAIVFIKRLLPSRLIAYAVSKLY
ncbi:MAG: SDR family oxidoreductase [Bacillota bacterium]|nr:SDR family oxidoreductase [Bacillota bacterium]